MILGIWFRAWRRESPRTCVLVAMLLLMAASLVASGCGGKDAPSDSKNHRAEAGTVAAKPAGARYACPMDPEITADEPDQRCSKCGMFLQPVEPGAEAATNAGEAAKAASTLAATDGTRKLHASASASGKQLFICPMHPTYVSDHQGDCPICGMRLVPAEQVSVGPEGIGVPGMAAIRLTEEGIRLSGVQTVAAEQGSMARTVRTVGIVAADEARVRRVQVKVEGYVERLYVNTPGQAVRKGDPLLAIYSPDLLAGQEEFRRALEARQGLERLQSGGESTSAGWRAAARGDSARAGSIAIDESRWREADLLVRAARERLRLFDVSDPDVDALERTRQLARTVTLRAPVAGVVTERMVYEGMKVMPGMELFTITDLSEIWIEGSFYESEAPFVAVGRPATLTLAYDPSIELHGAVKFVYPYLDPESRTLRARFSFANEEGMLKPGMYANVTMAVEGDEGLLVPDNAVMDTGERKIVFVSKGGGLFEPRVVETGLRGDGKVQVLAGVMAGEEVVVRANFLLDSESRIRAALSGGMPAPAAPAGEAGPGASPGETAGNGAGTMPGMPGL